MYEYYNPNPNPNINASDCVVRAFSKAFDISWESAYVMLSAQGYQDRDIFASDRVWNNLLAEMGYERKMIPDTYPICYTIADFATENDKGTYIIGTGRHAVTVKNGCIYDSWDSSRETPLFYFKVKE